MKKMYQCTQTFNNNHIPTFPSKNIVDAEIRILCT